MKGSKFAWTDEADATFHIMMERLMAAPILALPDLTHEFELHTDTSKMWIGDVFTKQGWPITFSSEKLSEARLNYNAGGII